MALRIEIDTDRCTGHGRCYSLAPELFDCDDGGYGVVVAADVTDAREDSARRAVRSCPERAVTCHEDHAPHTSSRFSTDRSPGG